MTSSGRSSESRRAGRSVGQWLLGLLIVLALAASILMVFTDQLSITGSLAVIAALWAAVIGAILVTKFRRQADAAESKSRDLRLVYELQLEREIAARRQYELDVESTIRKEIRDESNSELADLKAQVLALRSSLEVLLGESLPDHRVALPSERLRELASGIGGHSRRHASGADSAAPRFGTADDSAIAARDFAATAPAPESGRHTGRGVPGDLDPNEMTEIIPIVTDDAPISGRIATEVPAEVVEEQFAEQVVEAVEVPDMHPDATPPVDTVAEAEPVTAAAVPSGGAEDSPEVRHGGRRIPGVVFSDDTPTDEWPAQSAAHGHTPAADTEPAPAAREHLAYGALAADSPLGPAGDPATEAATADEPPSQGFTPQGRHEGVDAAAVPGRRRRRADDDDNAHSAGLPVSELLSQLRQSQSQDAGRRHRAD